MLNQIIVTEEAKTYFADLSEQSTHHKKKSKYWHQSLVIRLLSISGNKFKITFEVLKNDSIIDDFQNRDFTINAFYCELNNKRLLKIEDGLTEFDNRIMRTIKLPAQTFDGQINLFFRFIEFVIRYDLVIHSDIIQYFNGLSAKHDIFEETQNSHQKNFNSTNKKFFSKHYVSEML